MSWILHGELYAWRNRLSFHLSAIYAPGNLHGRQYQYRKHPNASQAEQIDSSDPLEPELVEQAKLKTIPNSVLISLSMVIKLVDTNRDKIINNNYPSKLL
jgi:hypothetical protein